MSENQEKINHLVNVISARSNKLRKKIDAKIDPYNDMLDQLSAINKAVSKITNIYQDEILYLTQRIERSHATQRELEAERDIAVRELEMHKKGELPEETGQTP